MKLLISGRKIIPFIWGTAQIMILWGCDIDVAPSYTSFSIAKSKKDGFFSCEYLVDSLQLADNNKPFIVRSVWAEKTHTITTNAWGKETCEKDDTSFHIVFDMTGNSYYNKNNDSRWLMVDEKDQWNGGEGGDGCNGRV